MASISRDKNGTKRLIFKDHNGKSHTVRLGKVNEKKAELAKSRVEAITSAKIIGISLDAETSHWLANIGNDLHAKLAKTGIISPRLTTALGSFCNQYLDKVKAKASTKRTMKQTTDGLVKYFGGDINPKSITIEMVEGFAESMRQARLSPSTIDKRLKTARQVFNAMIRAKLLDVNPFTEVKVTPTINEERNVYVERERVEKIIDSIADPEWKLIVGLSRYCGLRAPSEILTLTWDCILWDKKRIVVKSPKTEHYEGKDSRVIPMFEGIIPLLEAVYERAEPGGSPFVIARRRGLFDQLTDGRNTNLGTLFKKYILHAGETPWPKPFHAMRASLETDLLNDGRVKPHTIARWLGHSIQIALKHYARIKDQDYEIMTDDMKNVTPNATDDALSPNTPPPTSRSKASQKASKNTPEIGGTYSQQQSQVPIKTAPCESTQEAANCKMTPTGFEPVLQA